MIPSEALLSIAHSAVLAPSADNHHQFQLELLDSGLRVWATDSFAQDTHLHRRVLTWVSFGAAVENMVIRATHLGFAAQVEWPRGPDSRLIAELDFAAFGTSGDDELAAAIEPRHTNRKMYRGPALNGREAQALQSDARRAEGVDVFWLQGADRRRALGLMWKAESERFLRQTLHRELFESIRFDLDWRQTSTRDLAPATLEIETPARPMFKALRHWPLMRALSVVGGHRMVGLRAGWLPAWQAPTLGVMVTSLPVEEGARQIGRGFQRLWLRATTLDIALQPLAASTVLTHQKADEKGASDQLRRDLADGWRSIVGDRMPLMAFRAGRAAVPRVRAGREPLAHYLRQA